MSTQELFALAWELDARGFVGQEAAVRRVVRSARALGLSPTLVDLLADTTEPEVARLRAFGHVATALARDDLSTNHPQVGTAA